MRPLPMAGQGPSGNRPAPKVLMIGPGDSPPGGIVTLIQTLRPALRDMVDVRYFATLIRYRALDRAGSLTFNNVAVTAEQYARFVPAFLSYRPDVLHIHTSEGFGWLKDSLYLQAARLFGRPVVLHLHAADEGRLHGRRGAAGKAYTRAVLAAAGTVVTVSKSWARAVRTIEPRSRVETFYPCVRLDRFRVLPAAARRNILFLGSVGPRKGVHDLVRALAQALQDGADIGLDVAGPDDRPGAGDSVRGLVRGLGLENRVRLLGPVTGAAKDRLVEEAALLALPSYNEGLPTAIVEAFAAGTPAVATAVGGIPEIVRDGETGFLIEPGDTAGLARAIGRLAGDPELRRTMGRRARVLAEELFDAEAYAARMAALYRSVMRAGGRTP